MPPSMGCSSWPERRNFSSSTAALDAAVDDADGRRPRRWRRGSRSRRSGVSRAKTSSKTSRHGRPVGQSAHGGSPPRIAGRSPRRAAARTLSTSAMQWRTAGRAVAHGQHAHRLGQAQRLARRRPRLSRAASSPSRSCSRTAAGRRLRPGSGTRRAVQRLRPPNRWRPGRRRRRRTARCASAAPPAPGAASPPPKSAAAAASCRSVLGEAGRFHCRRLSNSSSTTWTPGATLSGAASSERRPRSNGCSSTRPPASSQPQLPWRTAPAG